MRYRAPAGAITEDLRAEARGRRAELLRLLAAEQAPPPQPPGPAPPSGARLYFELENAKPCLPEEAHHWTWEGAGRWLYTQERPPPPHRLAVAPWAKALCGRCVARELRVRETADKNGRKQLRCECAVCGAFVKFMSPPPGNLDLEWRAS